MQIYITYIEYPFVLNTCYFCLKNCTGNVSRYRFLTTKSTLNHCVVLRASYYSY